MSKFNVGDKVRYIGKDHNDMPEFYPPVGTIGTVVNRLNEYDDVYVQWEKGSTSKEDCWYCDRYDLELVKDTDMINEEIWEMLKPKMEKNGLKTYYRVTPYHHILSYDCVDAQKAIAIAYRSGYERAMKGRPFKFGEKKAKKQGGHWEPIDPNNLPKEGAKVRYKGGLKGCNWEQNSTAKWIKNEKDRFSIKFDGTCWTLDCINCLLKYFDIWVEDDE